MLNLKHFKMTDICTSLCTGCIPKVDIPNCGDIDLGKAVVKIFVQKVAGTGFSTYADLALQSEWQTKLAIADYGDCDDRIVAIGNLHDGQVPQAEQATEKAPYGGEELVNMNNTATWKIKRFNAALVAIIDKLRCIDTYNFWFLTNKGYLFGGLTGYQNTSIQWGNYAIEGFDTKSGAYCTATWEDKQVYLPVSASFLADLTNPA